MHTFFYITDTSKDCNITWYSLLIEKERQIQPNYFCYLFQPFCLFSLCFSTTFFIFAFLVQHPEKMSNATEVHFETTPRVYYENYMTPSYDLYPSLSRQVGNGYIYRPTRPQKQPQTNFMSMNVVSRRTNNNDDPLWQPQPQPLQQETPSWDLYPSVLRHVSFYIYLICHCDF